MKSFRKQAFTLIELLVSISLIIILLGVMIPAINAIKDAGKSTTTKAEIAAINSAINSYQARYGVYPFEDENGLLKNDTIGNSDDELWPIDEGWEFLKSIADKNDDGVFLLELDNYRQGLENDKPTGEVLDIYGNPYIFLFDCHNTNDEYFVDGVIQFKDGDNSFTGRNGKKYKIRLTGETEDGKKKDFDGDGDTDGYIKVSAPITILYLDGDEMQEIP